MKITFIGAAHQVTRSKTLVEWNAGRYFLVDYGMEQGENPYDREDYSGGCAIIIGNEGKGIRPETAKRAGKLVKIPMKGEVESLNAAVAATVLMYEVARQRR